MLISRAYKSRIEPTDQQRDKFYSWTGVRKFAYNDARRRKQDEYARKILSGEKPLKNVFDLRNMAKLVGATSTYQEVEGEWTFSLLDPITNEQLSLRPSIHGSLGKHVNPELGLPWLQARVDRLAPPQPKTFKELRGRAEFPWIKDAPAVVYREAMADLDDAFDRFWHPPAGLRVGFPKSDDGSVKRFRMSPSGKNLGPLLEGESEAEALRRLSGDYIQASGSKGDGPTCVYKNEIQVTQTHVKIPGLEGEWLKLSRRGYFPTSNVKYSEVSVHQRAGHWYLSLTARIHIPDPKFREGVSGVDMGHKRLLTSSKGKVYGSRRVLKNELRLQQRISRLGRRWDRQVGPCKRQPDGQFVRGPQGKQVPSKAWRQTKLAISRAQKKLADIRGDIRHQATTRLIRDGSALYRFEDIDVQSMIRKMPTAKAHDKRLRKINVSVGYYEIRRQAGYKAKWNGASVEEHKAHYTSQQCPHCGVIDPRMKSAEFWSCVCGFGVTFGTDVPPGADLPWHHRDFAAAVTHSDPEKYRTIRDSAWTRRSTRKGPADSGLPGRKSTRGAARKGKNRTVVPPKGGQPRAISSSERVVVGPTGGFDHLDSDSAQFFFRPASSDVASKHEDSNFKPLRKGAHAEEGTYRKPTPNPLIYNGSG